MFKISLPYDMLSKYVFVFREFYSAWKSPNLIVQTQNNCLKTYKHFSMKSFIF